jgi:hypothetical protein
VTRPLPDDTLHRIKAATRDLVKVCGGLRRVGEILGVSEQTVSRYQLPSHPELLPLASVLILEADCGLSPVTRAMAQVNGRDLAEPGEGAEAGCLMQRHADLMREVGDLMTTGADVLADGRVTGAEAERLDRDCGELETALGRLRADLASVKGGDKVAVFRGRGQ